MQNQRFVRGGNNGGARQRFKKPGVAAPANLLLALNLSTSGKNYTNGPPGATRAVNSGTDVIQTAQPNWNGKGAYGSQTSTNRPTIYTNGCKFGTAIGNRLALSSQVVLSGTNGWTVYFCGSIAATGENWWPLGAASGDPSGGFAGVGIWGNTSELYFINDATTAYGVTITATGKIAGRMRYDPVGEALYLKYTGQTLEILVQGSLANAAATATCSLIGQATGFGANGNASNIMGGVFVVNANVIPGSPEDTQIKAAMAAIDSGYAFSNNIPNQLAFFGDSRTHNMTVNSTNFPTNVSFGIMNNYGATGTSSAQIKSSITAHPAANRYAQYSVAVIWGGANDSNVNQAVNYGFTETTIMQCAAAASAAGYNKVILCTEISECGYASWTGGSCNIPLADIYHDTVNVFWKGPSGFSTVADAICDLGATRLGNDGDWNNPAGGPPYDFIDGIHPAFGSAGDATETYIYPTMTAAINTAT